MLVGKLVRRIFVAVNFVLVVAMEVVARVFVYMETVTRVIVAMVGVVVVFSFMSILFFVDDVSFVFTRGRLIFSRTGLVDEGGGGSWSWCFNDRNVF